MTTIWIIGMWVVAIGGMYLFSNVAFWLFAQAFGILDNYMQERHFTKRGFSRTVGEDGQEWYVGYDNRS